MDSTASQLARQFIDNGFAIFIIVAIGAFVERRLWPWYSKIYWPTREKQMQDQLETLHMISGSLIMLKTVVESVISDYQTNIDRTIRIELMVKALHDASISLSDLGKSKSKRPPRPAGD